jgi:pyocin large subunit-like protein
MRQTNLFLIVAGVAALGLSACDNGASAVETRDRAAVAEDAKPADAGPGGEAAKNAGAAAGAKPAVTANRRETTEAKVQRLFERNGADFGTTTAEAYLAAITAFTTTPPADAETVRRANGDTLIYQASTNTFAVVDSDGVPRTMFKPDDGADYWAKEKAAAPTFGQRRSGSESR